MQKGDAMFARLKSLLSVVLCSVLIAGCSSISMEGKKFLRQGQYDEAISLYAQHLQTNPGDIAIREQLGYAYLKKGEYTKAIAELKNVLDRKPESPFGILYLGLAYLKNNQLEEGVAVWNSFKGVGQPKIEEEMQRLLTVLTMAESKKYALEAVAREKKLNASRVVPNSYAVLYYNDLSPEKGLRAVQKGLAAMITTDLAKSGQVKVIERVRMDALVNEIKLGQTGAVDMKTAPRAGRMLGAENLVVGTLSTLLRDLLINSSVAASEEGKELFSFPKKDRLENFFLLEKEIVREILKKKRITLGPEIEEQVYAYHTQDFDAFLYFGQGLDAQDEGKWGVSKAFFLKALERDPKFELARQAYLSSPAGLGISIDEVTRMATSPAVNLSVANKAENILEQAGAGLDLGSSFTSSAPASSVEEHEGGEGGGNGGGGH